MGVQTALTLEEINTLFPSYNFTKIDPTSNGVMDTTYIVSTTHKSYILKKYERSIQNKIEADIKLLQYLKSEGLNVSHYITHFDSWYLYEKLEGREPKTIQTYHIQALARFMSRFHKIGSKLACHSNFIENYEIDKILLYIKRKHYFYYKKLQYLKNYKPRADILIHGDIFKDNTLFYKQKIAVIDFIDAGYGEAIFDIAVALLSFNSKKQSPYFINLFLNGYNQN